MIPFTSFRSKVLSKAKGVSSNNSINLNISIHFTEIYISIWLDLVYHAVTFFFVEMDGCIQKAILLLSSKTHQSRIHNFILVGGVDVVLLNQWVTYERRKFRPTFIPFNKFQWKKKLGKISYYICCFCSSYIASFFPIFIFYRKRLNEQFCLCLLWENNESNYKIYYLEYNSCF